MQPNWWTPYWHPDLEILQSVMKTFSSSSRSLSIELWWLPLMVKFGGMENHPEDSPFGQLRAFLDKLNWEGRHHFVQGVTFPWAEFWDWMRRTGGGSQLCKAFAPLCSLTADTGWPISSCSGCCRWELSLSPCLPYPNRLFSQTISHKIKLKLLSSNVLPQQPDKSLIQKIGPEAWVCRCSSPCSSSDLRTGLQHECGWVWSRGLEKALNAINKA